MGNDRQATSELIEILQRVRQAGFGEEPAIIIHDLGWMRARLRRLTEAFPAQTLHAVAIKANPLVEVLRVAVASGAGLEAASWEEVALAVAAGCPPERIVYDSPSKTVEELTSALRLGVHLNANGLPELDRLAPLLPSAGPTGPIGLRINPQVGVGQIAATSVAAPTSQFGVPITDLAAIEAAFRRHPWLTGLHIHVGSQGCQLEQLVEAARRVEQLRRHLERALGAGRIRIVDLGGGLPVAYRAENTPPTPEEYVARLRQEVPGLFDGVQLVTEFGRWVQAGAGLTVSRIETVRHQPNQLASLHVGADLFMRRVYAPEHWHHDFLALDAAGRLKEGARSPWTLSGPLCFGGDILARELPLPELKPGEHILIRDTGAYTLGLWSRHCSRGIPLVVGVDGEAVVVLRERETAADVVAFWSRRAAVAHGE